MSRKPKADLPEREFIRWIRRRLRVDSRAVPIGPGDDMAAVRMPSQQLLVAVDTVAEGVDFTLAGRARAAARLRRRRDATPREIGRKALAVNLSDVAAMGGVPQWCVASVNLREGLGAAFAKEVAGGLIAASRRYECPLVGGDITGWKDGVVVTVAIGATAAGKRAITRGGARPGDIVLVTGSLGGSILGKHLRFEPRLAEGAWLARHIPPTAMIDISDGLGVDAAHIAEESGAGITIREAKIPISRAAYRLSDEDGRPPLRHAISDGEDFELLFTLPPPRAREVLGKWPFDTRISVIGEVRKGKGVTLVAAGGKKARIDSEGYQHL